MNITITKDEDGIKFFIDNVLSLIIYKDTTVAMLRDTIITDGKQARYNSMAILLAGVFIDCLSAAGSKIKEDAYGVIYVNELTLETNQTKYSPRKVLNWIESDKIVTVNKKERTRHQFTTFAYRDSKIIIMYKPVIW